MLPTKHTSSVDAIKNASKMMAIGTLMYIHFKKSLPPGKQEIHRLMHRRRMIKSKRTPPRQCVNKKEDDGYLSCVSHPGVMPDANFPTQIVTQLCRSFEPHPQPS